MAAIQKEGGEMGIPDIPIGEGDIDLKGPSEGMDLKEAIE